jgi:hypothetical protein
LFFGYFCVNADWSELILSIFALVIGIAHAILPMDKVNERFFPIRDEVITDDRYSQVRKNFAEVDKIFYSNNSRTMIELTLLLVKLLWKSTQEKDRITKLFLL